MPSARKIAVAGATGRVGHHVVDVLTERGHDVVPMSRSQGVDVITGDGLAAALAGVECVIDAATGPSPEQQAATAFFTAAARNLQEAGQRAGVQRMIVVSIIGTDRFTAGYGAAPVHRRLRRREDRPRAGTPVRPHPGACAARRAVPRVRRPAGGVGHPGRGGLRTVAARTVAEALCKTRSSPRSCRGGVMGFRTIQERGSRSRRGAAPLTDCAATGRSPAAPSGWPSWCAWTSRSTHLPARRARSPMTGCG